MERLSSVLAVILFFTATSSAQQPDLKDLYELGYKMAGRYHDDRH
jgi:hypothetical protein